VTTAHTTAAPRRSPAKRDLLKAEAVAAALVVEVFVRELVIAYLKVDRWKATGVAVRLAATFTPKCGILRHRAVPEVNDL
jgi:molybdopterin biosynthesis enzyme